MMKTMKVNLSNSHEKLGPLDNRDVAIRQDDVVFWWSDSNCRYEVAWWLYEAEPSPLLDELRKERTPPKLVGQIPLADPPVSLRQAQKESSVFDHLRY